MPLNLNAFIFEHLAQSHFFPILKALSWAPNCSIVDCSCMLKMLDHYYPQNSWYFELQRIIIFSFISWQYFSTKMFLDKFFVNTEEFLTTTYRELGVENLCRKMSMLSKNSWSTCRLLIKTLFYHLSVSY